jgi:hypothetical protein
MKKIIFETQTRKRQSATFQKPTGKPNAAVRIIFSFMAAMWLLPFSMQGQIVFTSGAGLTQSENFDGISTTLPSGIAIGGSSTLTAATTLNGSSSGRAYKFAHGSDFAIGILNSGSYTSGKTITIQLRNNTNNPIAGFDIAFNYEKYRSGSRAWTWTLAGSAGTVVGGGLAYTADGGNTNAYFPPQQTAATATIRGLTLAHNATYTLTWTLTGTGGSTNGQALGIDDLIITALPSPTISAPTALASYGNVCIHTEPTPQMFTITGTNLTNQPLTIASNVGGPIDGYLFSTDGIHFSQAPFTLTQPGGSYSQDIFVKFMPVSVKSYSANIRITGGGTNSFHNINVPTPSRGVNTAPTLSLGDSEHIGEQEATISGMISDTGCSAVTAYGIEYSTSSGFEPGTGTTILSNDLTDKKFSAQIPGLDANTTYYYRILAINSAGQGQSSEASFTTILGLPVSWLYITGETRQGYTLLQWGTAYEAYNLRFDIERSEDGVVFEKIGSVETAPFSYSEKNYSFQDIALLPHAYYRIKQVDTDEKYSYSKIIKATRTTEETVAPSLYPVPATDVLNVQWQGTYYKILVHNNQGQTVQEFTLSENDQSLKIPVHALSPDIYWLEMRSENNLPVFLKFLISK